jgi:hypothetical protein
VAFTHGDGSLEPSSGTFSFRVANGFARSIEVHILKDQSPTCKVLVTISARRMIARRRYCSEKADSQIMQSCLADVELTSKVFCCSGLFRSTTHQAKTDRLSFLYTALIYFGQRLNSSLLVTNSASHLSVLLRT